MQLVNCRTNTSRRLLASQEQAYFSGFTVNHQAYVCQPTARVENNSASELIHQINMPPIRAQLLSIADDVIAAFRAWTLDALMPLHAPDCETHILPTSLGVPPQDNEEVAAFLGKDMTLTTTPWTVEYDRNETAVDVEKRKVVLYVKAQVGTIVGDYKAEYVFVSDFLSHMYLCVWASMG